MNPLYFKLWWFNSYWPVSCNKQEMLLISSGRLPYFGQSNTSESVISWDIVLWKQHAEHTRGSFVCIYIIPTPWATAGGFPKYQLKMHSGVYTNTGQYDKVYSNCWLSNTHIVCNVSQSVTVVWSSDHFIFILALRLLSFSIIKLLHYTHEVNLLFYNFCQFPLTFNLQFCSEIPPWALWL